MLKRQSLQSRNTALLSESQADLSLSNLNNDNNFKRSNTKPSNFSIGSANQLNEVAHRNDRKSTPNIANANPVPTKPQPPRQNSNPSIATDPSLRLFPNLNMTKKQMPKSQKILSSLRKTLNNQNEDNEESNQSSKQQPNKNGSFQKPSERRSSGINSKTSTGKNGLD